MRVVMTCHNKVSATEGFPKRSLILRYLLTDVPA